MSEKSNQNNDENNHNEKLHNKQNMNNKNTIRKQPTKYNSWRSRSTSRHHRNMNNTYLNSKKRYNKNEGFFPSYNNYDPLIIDKNNMYGYPQFPIFKFIPFYNNQFHNNPFYNDPFENTNKSHDLFTSSFKSNEQHIKPEFDTNKSRNKKFYDILSDYILRTVKDNEIDDVLKQPTTSNKFILDPNKEYKLLDKSIETIEDFIKIGKLYDPAVENEYPIDLKRAHNLIEPLTELNDMVGIDKIKQNILELIIYGIQDLSEDNMYHTIIQGPPGIGKTMLGMILAKIYHALGIIENNEKEGVVNPITGKKENFVIKVYKRSDLVGKYLGHTAAKTQEAIDSCKGGVMFIDEAYSLGNSEGRDSYSKEAIDTINQNLSENKNKFICIIAGYPEQIENCFLSYNEGLRRRFAFKYTLDKYTPSELCEILKRKIINSKWELSNDIDDNNLTSYIKTHIQDFENYGGDMETLLLNCKLVHSRRLFGKHPNERRKLSFDDIKNGYNRFVNHKRKQQNDHLLTMYS